MASKLEEEITERRQCDQRAQGMLSSMQVALGREQRAREAMGAEASRQLGLAESRIEGAEKKLEERI